MFGEEIELLQKQNILLERILEKLDDLTTDSKKYEQEKEKAKLEYEAAMNVVRNCSLNLDTLNEIAYCNLNLDTLKEIADYVSDWAKDE